MENQVQDALLFTSVECFLHTTERPGFPIREHWHYFGEIVRVLSGSLKVTCRDSTFRLNAGDAIFLNPLSPHALNYGEPGVAASYEIIRMDMEQFGFEFEQQFSSSAVQQFSSGEIDTDDYNDNKFECECPKCGFRFNK